ncbi:translation factor SUA5 [Magnetococcus marinus MC-1]|uniref:Translation factor SUA5 n=1 Tax=Magnetococcus marinus (strain ATCC BAA-1437 / JCM 17883 / MC-1) TaxID=156889 RepID=A0L8Q4_MAGMM|nr:L-threonylcarbamoyladenylate synthase [Magnetococcus marinus]ABK44347.1 translation factor SUA5 [Magnetococcus marinus MC-1]
MSQYFKIHPENPQARLLRQAAQILQEGGVIVYPTDTTYGLGCVMSNRKGVERVVRIKQLSDTHQLTLLCADLSDIANYARVDNSCYRLLKRFLPGPYTFVLEASREVPKKILPRRKTIGLRVPNHQICHALLELVGEPLLSTSVRLPGHEEIFTDPSLIRDQLEHQVDLIIDGGILPEHPSTIIDMTSGEPELLREGAGDSAAIFK